MKNNIVFHNFNDDNSNFKQMIHTVNKQLSSSHGKLQQIKKQMTERTEKIQEWNSKLKQLLLGDLLQELKKLEQDRIQRTPLEKQHVMSEQTKTTDPSRSSPHLFPLSYTWQDEDEMLKRQIKVLEQQLFLLRASNKEYRYKLRQKDGIITKYKNKIEELNATILEQNRSIQSLHASSSSNPQPRVYEEALPVYPISGKQFSDDEKSENETKRTWMEVFKNFWTLNDEAPDKSPLELKVEHLEKELTEQKDLVHELKKTILAFKEKESYYISMIAENEKKELETTQDIHSKLLDFDERFIQLRDLIHQFEESTSTSKQSYMKQIEQELEQTNQSNKELASRLTTSENQINEVKKLIYDLSENEEAFIQEMEARLQQEIEAKLKLEMEKLRTLNQANAVKTNRETRQIKQQEAPRPQSYGSPTNNQFLKQHQNVQPALSKQPERNKARTNPSALARQQQQRYQNAEQGGTVFNPLKYNYRPPQ
ncbi:hypothetical protein LC065_13265 [Halobacillus litoralis]|uniref:hypothetical protein n=1 Tax=Halobacillus litoralis TaxID=45668 RepID=UPI001CFF1B79|nr:hypothetical protein [Halobacillus litoralis]WLR46537.1 hypothetical protein LC065_13265 [Halobacillus litoralis]